MGTAFVDAEPLPPGLDWDYFGPRPGLDESGELGDTESPAVDAVFDWGNPLIGRGGCRLPTPESSEGLRGPRLSAFGQIGAESAEDAEICERVPVVSGGERFRHLVRQLRARGAVNPQALAAWIGRRKYGAARFARMAAAGRR